MTTPKRPRPTPRELVYIIEFRIDALDPEGLDESLSALRQYGSAEVIDVTIEMLKGEKP